MCLLLLTIGTKMPNVMKVKKCHSSIFKVKNYSFDFLTSYHKIKIRSLITFLWNDVFQDKFGLSSLTRRKSSLSYLTANYTKGYAFCHIAFLILHFSGTMWLWEEMWRNHFLTYSIQQMILYAAALCDVKWHRTVFQSWQGFWYFVRSRCCEFQVNPRNPAKFTKTLEIPRNSLEILPNTCRHNIFESYLDCWGCLLAVNLLIYLETSSPQWVNNILPAFLHYELPAFLH